MAIRGSTLFHRAVDATPVVGGIKGWTQETSRNSRTGREITRAIIIAVIFMMLVTLYKTFDLIMLDKVNAVVGTLIGGIFTFYGTVLAVTIPAFMNSKTVGLNQPVDTTSNSADNKDLAEKKQ